MNIAIIGGGASGIMAAITAAKNGANVTIYEKKERIGKKILATGNGKCNFTNKIMNNADFNSQYKDIFNDYISQFDKNAVISFFETLGMLTKEKNGYCYPRSEQASTVLDLLRLQLKKYSDFIVVNTETYPVSITKKKKDFELILNTKEKKYFNRVILACGSFAGEKKQDEFSGYSYAKNFGHKIIPVVPALVQLRVSNTDMKAIAGVRCDANISLYIENELITQENGELQLTDYGISGIPTFQLSRFASYGLYYKKQVYAKIDLLPEMTMEEFVTYAKLKYKNMDETMTVEEYLQGFLNKKLNLYFLKLNGIKADYTIKSIPFSKLENLFANMKNWKVSIISTNPFENAQVCAGGVTMEEVSLQLESKLIPGLFFAGELLDVDARCGGYNLQWAWTSGFLAGTYAAK